MACSLVLLGRILDWVSKGPSLVTKTGLARRNLHSEVFAGSRGFRNSLVVGANDIAKGDVVRGVGGVLIRWYSQPAWAAKVGGSYGQWTKR